MGDGTGVGDDDYWIELLNDDLVKNIKSIFKGICKKPKRTSHIQKYDFYAKNKYYNRQMIHLSIILCIEHYQKYLPLNKK